MKNCAAAIILFLFFGLLLSGCTDPDMAVEPTEINKNLLENPSFEKYGRPNLEGWILPLPPLMKISKTAPPGCGQYSVFLKARNIGGAIRTVVAVPAGRHAYKFSFWSRCDFDNGIAELILISRGKTVPVSEFSPDKNYWAYYSITDTILTEIGDSLKVELSGALWQSPQPYVWYDMCKLEIDPDN